MTVLYLLVLAAVAWRVRWSQQAILAAGILGVGMLLGEGKWAFGLSMLACYLVMWNHSTIAGWRESFGEWWRRIRRTLRGELDIDWIGFAVTRGCFMVGYFPVELADERTEKRDVALTSGDGFCAPDVFRPRWEPWADWYHLPRLMNTLPMTDGGIRFPSLPPLPPLPHEIVADTAKDQWDY